MRFAVLFTALILASCSSDGETIESFADPDPVPSATVAPSSSTTETPTTTTEPLTTTTTTTTTTTLPPDASAAFGLSQVVFGDGAFIILTNWGDDTGDLAGYWLSQDQAFQALQDVSLAPGEQALLGLATVPPPELAGIAVTVHIGPAIGFLDPLSGEVALISGQSFDDPASLVAYVEWGNETHTRSELATAAGLWDGVPIAVFDDAPSISTGVYPAAQSLDWSVDIGG